MQISKYINKTTIVTTICLGIAGLCWNFWIGEVQAYQEMKKQVQLNTEQRQQNEQFKVVLEQIAIDVKEIRQRQLTVQGKARVEEHGDDSGMKVNVISSAADYRKQQFARITNLSSEEQPSIRIKIVGTFRHADSNYVAILSHRAGELLSVESGEINIRIEPEQGE